MISRISAANDSRVPGTAAHVLSAVRAERDTLVRACVPQSKRKTAYEKSPGQYLGPAWASFKYNQQEGGGRGSGGGGRMPERGG